jgi:hypothetical protein
MTDYREINALQRDLSRAKSLAEYLLMLVGMDWTDWEVTFLNSIIRQVDERLKIRDTQHALSIRQVEILVELRDESVLYERPEGFSIRSLVNDCLVMQHRLNENELDFVKHHKAAGTTKLRRRQVNFLFHCARKALAIEPYHGWKPTSVDSAA